MSDKMSTITSNTGTDASELVPRPSPTVTIHGKTIPVKCNEASREHLDKALSEPKFTKWVSEIGPTIVPSELVIHHIKMFGPVNVGFITFELNCTHRTAKDKKGNPMVLPGFVFLRGDSVACLILIGEKETGRLLFLTVVQTRVASGKECEEGPAGMCDRSVHKFTGPMMQEIREETGIEVELSEIIYLGDVEASPGGTAEILKLHMVEKTMTSAEIAQLQGKQITNGDEHIRVNIRPFTLKHVNATRDPKVMCAVAYLLERQPRYFARMMAQE